MGYVSTSCSKGKDKFCFEEPITIEQAFFKNVGKEFN